MTECEIPEFYNSTERKARKQYNCCECHAPIFKGEVYLYCVGRWNWGLDYFRQHLVCANACRFVRDTPNFNGYECIGFGTLLEWYDETKDWLQTNKLSKDIKIFRQLMYRILMRERGRIV